MQGTVATFESATGAGSLFLDDGTRLSFDGAAFATSGLRLLRLGQRVSVEIDGDIVTALRIPTMPATSPPS
ncbi:cold-shock protein [Stackebrandtia soli]|uniref:cold-shock protein n=1 Tax=Stackebrandtia soli TaxID=1892856 RepID=UPI0039EB9881